jgi:non-canonical poly(A) RNA polymerase PAPD5/7
VDIVCLLTEEEEARIASIGTGEGGDMDMDIKKQSPMKDFADALLQNWGSDLVYLEVIEHTRIPIVKCTHGPTNISVDISFDLPTGPKAAKLMRFYLKKYPPLRPLTMVLKQFLACRNLNQPYHGGIGSFALQLMITSMLQNRYTEDDYSGRPHVANLGCMLMDFFELYGINFNYVTTGISLEGEGGYFQKANHVLYDEWYQSNRLFQMSIENPLEPGMDVGKGSFRIGLCKRSFEVR